MQAISASSARSGIAPVFSAPKWTRVATEQTTSSTARPTGVSSQCVSRRPSRAKKALPT